MRSGRSSARDGGDLRRRLHLLTATGTTTGLLVVLVVLALLSTAGAVLTARARASAQASETTSELARAVVRVLAVEESVADDIVDVSTPTTRANFDSAHQATSAALLDLGARLGGERDAVDTMLRMHRALGERADRLLEIAAVDPDRAETYEHDVVDPRYEAIGVYVAEETNRFQEQAQDEFFELGRKQSLLATATPIVFAAGIVLVGISAVAARRSRREIIEQVELNQHQANHDPLTSLPNRAALQVRAAEALASSGTDERTVAVLYLDLDRFKEINDTLGHHYGDRVLRAVADRLSRVVRPDDIVGRLGGDEFAVILRRVADVDEAVATARRIRTAIQRPVEVDGLSLDVDASIGVALGGPHGTDLPTLLRRADIAMYSAKHRGLGVASYLPELDAGNVDRLSLLSDLRRALDGRELVLHYQPKVDLRTGRVAGVEALIRWMHPTRGTVPPDVFIPMAERTALIRPLTLYVLETALEACRRWRDRGIELPVAVNVSARNLVDDHFVDDVLAIVARSDVPASWIDLEVTESAIMGDPGRAVDVIRRLTSAGMLVSIDDFGAGYTSLAHLKNLPVRQLKIDRSFVGNMEHDEADALIVRSVVELARNLGLTTVAEGVEDRATWDHLSALGCDVAQGYLMARPMPVDQLDAWLEDPASAVCLADLGDGSGQHGLRRTIPVGSRVE